MRKPCHRDHMPPHFHVDCDDHKAEFAIETRELMVSSLPRRPLGVVIEWAVVHRAELLIDWDLCRRHERPNRIEPPE